MMTITVATLPGTSPFDGARRVTDDGTEFWWARDLMELMGYASWRNFEVPLARAMKSAEAHGHPVADHFARSRRVIDGGRWGSQSIEDFRLTRFGAYLVAMNGDPNMQQVAAAQAYFAIRTREAETATSQQLDEIEVAERYLVALRERKALAAKVERQRPLVAQAEAFREADGLRTIGDLANDLKIHAATNYPGVKVHQADVFDLAGRIGLVIRGNTIRKNQPTARAIEAGWVKPKEAVYETNNHGTQTKVGSRLTPRGYGRLWDAAVANLREHGVVLPKLKEIDR